MSTLIRFLTFSLAASSFVLAKTVEYDLTISERTMALGGKPRPALTLNGGIPGPTLRFREGDTAVIRVTNALRDEETSIHWHGLLVPNAQDGVPYMTTPPIPPGETLTYNFKLKHSGTYWYHSHTGLQEQRGVYGSIVVEPKGGEPVKADREHVLVLSDWTNEDPTEVMRTLMRGSEWYAIRKGNAQSLWGAFQAGALGDYWEREKVRMPPMDVSDVAYDAFLINGRTRSELTGKPGEKIRLRVINSAASTYFYLQSATGPLTIVAADGPAVQPVQVNRLLIGMAETYDLIVTIPKSGSFEFRATAQDNSGHASVFLGEGKKHHPDPLPSPDLYAMDEMLSAALEDEDTSLEEMRVQERPAAPYAFLRAREPTTLKGPVREMTMRLTGDMRRYIWSFDNKTLAEDSVIPVRKGEVLRVELINDTMMHHPLHLHGHFFRVINRHGAYSPLKHTIDVPPMGRRTIEFLADEKGDWFFHCHLLYHMDAGMARVFSYRAADEPSYKPALDPKLINPWFFMVDGMLLHNMTMGDAMVMVGRENFGVMWDYAFGHHHKEYEVDLYWTHYFDANLSSIAGYRLTNEHHREDRFFAGVQYRLPYLVESAVTLDTEGDLRLDIGKEFQLTDRLSMSAHLEYDTNSDWEARFSASYLLNKQFSLMTEYSTDHDWGFGIGFSF